MGGGFVFTTCIRRASGLGVDTRGCIPRRRAERALIQRDARRAPRGLFRAPVGEQADGTLPRPHRRELLFLVQEAQLLPPFLSQYRGARRRHRGGDLRAPEPSSQEVFLPPLSAHIYMAPIRVPRDQVAPVRRLLHILYEKNKRARDRPPRGMGRGSLFRREVILPHDGFRDTALLLSRPLRHRILYAGGVTAGAHNVGRVPARPLQRGRRVPNALGGNETDGYELDGASAEHHHGFRQGQPFPYVVPWGAQLSGGASPVPEDMPRQLSRPLADSRGYVQGIQRHL